MNNALIIWLPLDLEAPWHWRLGSEGAAAQTDAEKQGLSAKSRSELTIILPGQWVRIFPHDLPKMRDNERLSAAGFAIEDKVALPLVDQHLVIGSGDDRRIAVITKAKITSVQDSLARYALRPDHVIADFDSLSALTSPLYLSDRTVQPGAAGYTLDRDWTDGALPAAQTPQDVLSSVRADAAVNLMSGAFARRVAMPVSIAALSKIAAAMLFAGLAWTALQAAQIRALGQQAEATRAQIAALYTDYTGEPAPPNPALTVTRAVQPGSGNASSDFMTLSSILFDALPSVDGITVETLQYEAAKNELAVRFIYPRFESATFLEQAVTQSGGVFRAGGVREQGGRLIGDAVIAAGSAP